MGKILHASGSGYFTSCIQNGAGFWSLQKAMDLYWRIRTWELNLSLTYLVVGTDELVTVGPESPFLPLVRRENETGFPEDGGAPLTDEEQLVCFNPYASTGAYTGAPEDPFAYVGCVGATTDGTLYTPNFSFFATFEAFIIPGLDPDRFQFEIGSVGQSGGKKSFSIYESTPISFKFFPHSADDGEYTFVNATICLEPTEWWSYGGTYITFTGARL
jgi:hypothetical protein